MLPILFEICVGLASTRQLMYLHQIMTALLSLSGAVSMASISRLSGIPYRTLQRFYAGSYNWNAIRFRLYHHFAPRVASSDGVVLLSLDGVVEDKCGTNTFGLGWFYSGLHNKVVKGIGVLQISAVHSNTGKSYPLAAIQLEKNEADEKRSVAQKAKKTDLKKRKAAAKAAGIPFVPLRKGRKKGTKNKAKSAQLPVNAAESMLLRHTKLLLSPLKKRFDESDRATPSYLVGDGAFGNQYYVELARQNNLHLISKLKKNAVLILPFQEERKPNQKGRGKKYGEQLDTTNMPQEFLVKTLDKEKKNTRIDIYQVQAYNQTVSEELLNIVLIQETHLHTNHTQTTILFSTDLLLLEENIRKYYKLRFPIEIDFRDAKQYFGLRDFKNIKKQQVNNAIQIAITATLVARIRAEQLTKITQSDTCSTLDVKAYYRARYYIHRIFKCFPNCPKQFLSHDFILQIAKADAINLARAA